MNAALKKIPLLWSVRNSLRAGLFRGVRGIFSVDDGREVLSANLRLHNALPAHEEFSDFLGTAPSYAELPGDEHLEEVRLRSDIVFLTGRYRSGSTLLWNIFRHLPGTTAFYEPFNERRWFDPESRGSHTDATHVNVDDYWREYSGLASLGSIFDGDWKFRHLYMNARSWNPRMQAYIEALIRSAKGRPVLQFNEVDYRLPWLRSRFPNAKIVHIYRHPRDQWCSTLGTYQGDMTRFSNGTFAPHDGFYLLRYAEDLRHYFPFLSTSAEAHPYELFYQLWKLSWLFGQRYADTSLSLEDLSRTPAAAIGGLLEKLTLPRDNQGELASLVNRMPLGRWRSSASNEWFLEIERRADVGFRNYFGVTGKERWRPAAAAGISGVPYRAAG